jgi:hypothetical protein
VRLFIDEFELPQPIISTAMATTALKETTIARTETLLCMSNLLRQSFLIFC